MPLAMLAPPHLTKDNVMSRIYMAVEWSILVGYLDEPQYFYSAWSLCEIQQYTFI